jgi:hypothetical protein
MAFDVEAAKAEGYSDEDIEKYLASQGQTISGQPIPATPAVAEQVPLDRSNEYMGLAGAGAVGAGAALAGKALILDPIRQGISAMMKPSPVAGPVAPSPQPAPRPMPQTAPVAQASAQQTSRQAMADKVRQIAAQRIAGFGASGAAVPAAVAAGGAAATGIAGGQMAAMTPEQRKAYYDSMMMGAMSGDAGLAAAIMNRGQ